VTEFFPERFPAGAYYGRQLGVNTFSFEAVIEYGDKIYAEMGEIAQGTRPIDRAALQGSMGEHSQLIEILDSIALDRRMTFTANLPNQGAVANLPDTAVLELTSVATGRGIHALPVPDFSPLLAAPLLRSIAAQQVTVEAALSGSRALFVEALLLDGCVTDPVTAGRLVDDLLQAQRAYLPQFA